MARRHAETFLELLKGQGFAEPNPRPMFPNPPGLLRLEPYSAGLRERIWWGSSSNATSKWAATLGMNLQSSTQSDVVRGERGLRITLTVGGRHHSPVVPRPKSEVCRAPDREIAPI